MYIEKKPNKPLKLDFCAVAGSERTVGDIIYPDKDDDVHQNEKRQSKKAKGQPEWKFQSKINRKKNFGPWIMYDKDKKSIKCQMCSEHPELAGTTDYISASKTLKGFTLNLHKYNMSNKTVLAEFRKMCVTIEH